jgi:enoyl-CoA hydratase/carnithine racemase
MPDDTLFAVEEDQSMTPVTITLDQPSLGNCFRSAVIKTLVDTLRAIQA